ncbi:MAG: cache domain-containing protein, partial [Propionivibrio sp.]
MKFGIAAKLGVLLALVGVLAAGATGFYSYAASRKILIDQAKNDLAVAATGLFRRIRQTREEVSRNLQILTAHPLAVEALQGGQRVAHDRLAELYRQLMAANPAYLQVRLISLDNIDNGREQIRIDRHAEQLVRVGDDGLQQQGTAPYVQATRRLPAGATYLSRFGVEREPGSESYSAPGKLAAQLAMPVLDRQQQVIGVVVISVDLEAIFSRLSADVPRDYQLYLANSDGDFLMHPNPKQTLAFARGPPARIQDEFPPTHDLVAGRSEQAFVEADAGRGGEPAMVAAFLSRPIAVASAESRLIIGLAVPRATVLAQVDQLGNTMLKIVLGIYLVCILVALLVARVVTRPINRMSEMVQRFADGHQAAYLHTDRADEIGVLARSFHNLQNQIDFQMNELRRSREEVEHLARHDALTGLANR